jgi:hypothetical protein
VITFKTVLSSAATLGLVLAGTAANAEAIRSGAATPGVVSVKKTKLLRTTAPAANESKAIIKNDGSTLWLSALAAVAAGTATYFITRDGEEAIDSPGA